MGSPGARFHLRDGLIIAGEGPGSPGVDALVLTASADDEPAMQLREDVRLRFVEAANAARRCIDVAELQALATESVLDAAFAATVGDIERYTVDGGLDEFIAMLLSATTGVRAEDLTAETARRLAEFASLPVLLSPFRERVVPAEQTDQAELGVLRQEILAQASGRRSARDIAFATGRSTYATAVEISRMLSEGLLTIAAPTAISTSQWGFVSVRPRSDATGERDQPQPAIGPLPSRQSKSAEQNS